MFTGLMARFRGAMRGSTMGELVALAWPIAAAMLGESALGLVDTKLVGKLGAAALGGVGMATTLLFLGYATVFGLMRGVKVATAYAVGRARLEAPPDAKDANAIPPNAIRYATVGVIFGAMLGLGIWVVAHSAATVLGWLNVDPTLVPYALDYLEARTTGAFAACALAALIQYRQGIGDSRTPMLVTLGGNVVNAGLAYSLIYGHFGLPALGVRGAGYGTAITELLECCVLLALLVRDARVAGKPSIGLRQAAREVATLGAPTGIHFGLETAAFTAFTAVLGSLGAAQLAAHHVALSVLRASFLPGIAIAEAASVLVARALAQRRIDEADRVARTALLLGTGFMSLCGVFFALFGGAIAAAFADDEAVVAIAKTLLLIAAVFQTLDAVNIILRGALRGAKDVRWVAVAGVTIAWTCIPGAALLLGHFAGLGAVGGWCGFVFETSLASLLMWRRWSRGPWRAAFQQSSGDAVHPEDSIVLPHRLPD